MAQPDETPSAVPSALVPTFQQYVIDTAKILLAASEEELRSCVESEASKKLVDAYVSNGDTGLVLQKRTISDETKSESNNGTVKYAYELFGEIPEDGFDTKKGPVADYIVYVKLQDAPLNEGSIASQVLVTQLNSRTPLSYVLPYIRHSFVPTASRLAQMEEQKQRGVQAVGKSTQVLDKLRELEAKLVESQDESMLSGVSLDPVKAIQEYIDLCTEEQKTNIAIALDKTWELIQSNATGLSETEQRKVNVLKALCEEKALNEIQNCLKQWKEQIQTVLRRSSTSGLSTVRKQLRFWEGKKTAITELEKQLQSSGVQASLHVLKLNKKIFWITTFQTLGVEDAQKEVDLHFGVLSAFPLQNVITATSVQDLIKATTEIFRYLDSQRVRAHYSVDKIAQLGRDSGRDVAEKLLEILSKDVMFMKYADFASKTAGTDRLFREFQHRYSKVQTEVRHQRLRQHHHAAWNLRDEDSELNGLEKRVEGIKQIRESHHELEKVIDPSFSSSDKQLLEEARSKINEAYEIFRSHDVLKCSDSQWKQCVDSYNAKIEEVEEQLRSMIRSKMEEASSDPREMFRVCEKFNKLFVRDKIRTAVWDFQQELITNVEREVKELQERYRKRYAAVPASVLTELRDIPVVSGEVIWLKQLKRQLDSHEKRVEAVLGEKWQDRYNTGQQLAQLIARFASKLDPKPLIDEWVTQANALPPFDSESFIFSVDKGISGGHMSLKVNFDEKYVVLFKEMRRLTALGIRIHKGALGASRGLQTTRIDVQLTLDCIDVKRRYPVSVKLKEAVSIFTRTCQQIERSSANVSSQLSMMPDLFKLVDEHKKLCQRQLVKGADRRWSTPDRLLNEYVDTLAKHTIELQDGTQKAVELTEQADQILSEFEKCPLVPEELEKRVQALQKIVSQLDDKGFSGVIDWTDNLNIKVENALLGRVEEVIDGWRSTLDTNWPIGASPSDIEELRKENPFWRNTAILHVIKMTPNQKIEVEPPITEAKMILGQDLQMWLAMIVSLKRPRSDTDQSEEETTFRPILDRINMEKIVDCYSKIHKLCEDATKYALSWLSYQALWDLKSSDVFEALGDDIGKWRRLLNDMKQAQAAFDTTDTEKSFGPIVIQFGNVRGKVDAKYTEFRKETFKKLFIHLDKILRDFHNAATKGKYELEETSFTVSTISDIVKAVTLLQRLKDESSGWEALWEECKEAEKLLQANRYVLPPTWIRASRMRGVLDDFFAVLDKRWKTLQTEAQSIYGKLEQQFAVITTDIQRLEDRWHTEKPTQGWAKTWTDEEVQEWLREYQKGSLRFALEGARNNAIDGRALHKIATSNDMRIFSMIQSKFDVSDTKQQELLVAAFRGLLFTRADVDKKLGEFETALAEIEKSYKDVKNAKEAMRVVVEIKHTDEETEIERMLDTMHKELAGLKEVHKVLSDRQDELDKIGEQKFLGMDSKALGKILRQMEDDLGKLPNKIRQYQAYNKFVAMLKQRQKMNKNLFGDLSCGVLRQKHWNELDKVLNFRKSGSTVEPNGLTLEDVWSIDLLKFAKSITDTVTIARGESNVENFLNEINEKWNKTFFELVDYKGKCPLVKNWTELREDVAEALTNVMSMKQSPFYKTFEREGAVWDEKLNAAQAIFDVMVDVQRRWVYLQGVFNNSADVQKSLGNMFQKFKGFDRDFVQLMRSIKQDPLVDHWVTPEKNLLQIFEANQNTLNIIQKALNEYLESQRSAFARFYFIGDEDLLEIIGSSKDPKAINRHLSKMFAGIAQIRLHSENESIITGMASREAEEVLFKQPVDVTKSERIQDWLLQVEHQMRFTLASLLEEAVATFVAPENVEAYFAWVGRYPAQVALLATQVRWSEAIDNNLKKLGKDPSQENHNGMEKILQEILSTLEVLANRVLGDIQPKMRKLYEQLITELVYQRDVTRTLIKEKICTETDFKWLYRMRFYWNRTEKDVLRKLEIRISRAKFFYGFEYFGATERLVQTPLTDKAYLTLCEALHAKLGGNPFGPAGTGKTESVKALGAQLGRFVLVFCCDETFDYNAMSRIFVGLCQCGAWGCFDEFNRLEEQILSAVSQQILTIQTGLREEASDINLSTSRGVEKVRLNPDMGIFVTMNPGYAGRSELPDNLKQLFRGMAMMQPNRVLIAQVMLFSQGFGTAEQLSSKIVLLFELCNDQLSKQSHYDFGLRALKAVLRSAGNLKRREQMALVKKMIEEQKAKEEDIVRMPAEMEEGILIRSLMSTVVPKLVMNDKFLFDSLLESAFPGANIEGIKEEELKARILEVAKERHYRVDEQWLVKLMQFHTIQDINWGVMLVGPSGSGKSSARDVLMEAMRRVDGVKTEKYEIDPKAINKEQLYGVLDPTTLEWTDGVFTATLRTILGNVHGEEHNRHWIVFDGDVDPEWAENLNSVLDDNKMLTLPNGERLALTDNIRIIFETPNLNAATPATVSRCGMVWFSEECVTLPMLFHNQLETLRTKPTMTLGGVEMSRPLNNWQHVHNVVVDYLTPLFANENGLIYEALRWVQKKEHVMEFTETRAVWTLFSQLRGGIRYILEYNESNESLALSDSQIQDYMGKYLLYAMIWAFGGPMKLDLRAEFSNALCEMVRAGDSGITVPQTDAELTLIDFEITVEKQEWVPWKQQVVNEELTPQRIKDPTVVINTIDTIRHSKVIGAWLQERRPVILCGPPGSGKSMTLTAVLTANPQCEMVTLNFSSTADPNLLFKCFEQYCKVVRSSQGYILRPAMQGKLLVIFCDECNLPAEDKYGTQTIVTFIRQLIEKGGYWNPTDRNWIQLENIQIVGACNPPTDAGRVVLSPRFLNHCPLVLVDFPGRESLLEIYGTFIRALLKLIPPLKGLADNITTAMVDLYQKSQRKFNTDIQAHYVYSPRELSRWTRAMHRALDDLDNPGGTTSEEIVRLWAHEALRLFSDRLVTVEERNWTWNLIKEVADTHFSGVNLEQALAQPILFSDYLSSQKNYVSVGKEEMREYILQRIKAFNEEELDVQLVIYNELLDHILRIDRVLRQPLGHLLMVGASGAGKTVFSRFVSWLNGMSTFQIKVHKDYTPENFDEDLRGVLIRAGVEGEKITFIFDESNILDTAFLERMNALLASGEVPGLFEEAELQQLFGKLREQARKEEELKETDEELYQWFTKRVQTNLHIVFTMNPAGGDFGNRATTSPALFNRCVINWWGTWSNDALIQVAKEFTERYDLEIGVPPELREQKVPDDTGKEVSQVHFSVANTILQFHQMVEKVMEYLAKNMARSTFITPRHYLDLIKHFGKLFEEKRQQLEEEQKHLSVGLKALQETEEEVSKRQIDLNEKEKLLSEQQRIADDKLTQMVQSEKEATRSREEAVRVEAEVQKEMVVISTETEKVEAELAEAKPALEAAQKSVKNIKKSQLDEIKAMKNPPERVKLTLQAVCILLGIKIDVQDWSAVIKATTKADFIPSILNFDTDSIAQKTRDRLNKEYLANPEFQYDLVNKSSQACGPMVLWVQSQVKFAKLLNEVEPMRAKIRQLKEALSSKEEQAKHLKEMVIKLEGDIKEYKAEYAKMVQRITELKNEMAKVQTSMARAKKLLEDLSEEKHRWSEATKSFEKQLGTLVGDCLLSAGFLTYIGYYNITYRQILIQKWKQILTTNNLPFNEHMELASYLSTPAERIAWKAAQLPEDDLCVENAIILKRFNRYPLLIDPSGQATNFLLNYYKQGKIVRTSFLDSAFLNNLENGLRFGNSLVIEDVENLNPIINPVLNNEIQTVGGRNLIRLASKDVDFSPTFTMFLVTRDPSAGFAPDLCSRVTFVNFSVTPSSLQSQCLSQVLRSEAPDIDEQRTDQLRLQGEFKFQLRELEDQLLDALNSITGNILDDENIMTTLENLKLKAKVVQEKAEQSERILQKVEEASKFYTPFARACTKLYFSWESLSAVHFLYQFDLRAFLDIVNEILQNEHLEEFKEIENPKDRESRLIPLLRALHRLVYVRTKRSLLVKDHMTFAFRVAQVYIDCHPDSQKVTMNAELLSYLLKGIGYKEGKPISESLAKQLEITSIGASLVGNLYQLNGFESLQSEIESNVEEWAAYRGGPADANIPNNWESKNATSAHAKLLEQLVIQKAFRPDQMVRSARSFVEAVFNWKLYEFDANADSLHTIVVEQQDQDTPLLMASTPGNDPSVKIDALAAEHFENKVKSSYEAFAMGSPEDYAKADNAITAATKKGTWVLLKNVHLSPQWLQGLEKRLHRMKKHEDFRLFMTMEIHPKVPVTLLRKSLIIINEPPLGIKASLQRTFNNVSAARVDKAPRERSRMYILLAWLHAVVLERLRFEPMGWSKGFEFSETDKSCAMDAMDEWIDRLAQGRDNVDPNDIPWDALHKMLVQFVYGGRIDNEFDTSRLTSFVENLFNSEAYNSQFALASRCIETKEPEIQIGRLGFVVPEFKGEKLNREVLARVVQIADSNVKVVFLQKYVVFGNVRVNLNGQENWVKKSAFRPQQYTMKPEIVLPSSTKLADIKKWVLEVDDNIASNPAMLGLPPRAELLILAERGQNMCVDLMQLQDVEADNAMDELTALLDNTGSEQQGSVPGWMKDLRNNAAKWLEMLNEALPQGLNQLREKPDSIRNPLFRFMRRELNIGARVLKSMKQGLTQLIQFVDGTLKATNDLRRLVVELSKETIPKQWSLYVVGQLGVTHWILDFIKRTKQLNHIAQINYVEDPYQTCLWLGGMFSPQGFTAATRQYVAQKNKDKRWSLESLVLSLEVGKDTPESNCFIFEGLTLFGAGWDKQSGCLILSDKTNTPLPVSRFRWTNMSEEKDSAGEFVGQAPDITYVAIPVYLNQSFKELLFSVRLPVFSCLPSETWTQRAVSISVWTT